MHRASSGYAEPTCTLLAGGPSPQLSERTGQTGHHFSSIQPPPHPPPPNPNHPTTTYNNPQKAVLYDGANSGASTNVPGQIAPNITAKASASISD